MFKSIDKLSKWQKTIAAMGYDFLIALMAFHLSLALRLGKLFPDLTLSSQFLGLLLLVGFTQSATFYANGLYRGLWRYSSTPDLIRVIRASFLAVIISFFVAFIYMRLEAIPRSVFIINWTLLVIGLGGGRLLYRIFRDHYQYARNINGESRVLIVGAGAGGERLLREIKRDDSLHLNVIGFVDDSPSVQDRSLHNVPVLGTTADLPTLIKRHKVKNVFIAIPSAKSGDVRRIYEPIKKLDVEIKILPRMSEIFQGRIEFSNLEEIKIEDLLGREEIKIDLDSLGKMLRGKKVLVTGAGGSIGSELCNQLASFAPSCLVALDISELNVYQLERKIRQKHPALNLKILVADVRDPENMEEVFERERPEVVLHAAAYKHVPLMEFNPYQAIKTNVWGTTVIARCAQKFEAERFVLVSTDKAVNPTNIMGATKRVAEMVVENLNKNSTSTTKLIAVRFGNVLGSSGSVIPLFREQIKAGGPITVTHKEITRYFMSIPEASKLVLQAGAIGSGGELFVLDMGGPVKIMDMAREMISLAGLHEGVDIEIEVTGLRPGEKLYEEPLMDIESAISTPHPKVKVCQARSVDEDFYRKCEALLNLSARSSRDEFVLALRGIVPEYVADRVPADLSTS